MPLANLLPTLPASLFETIIDVVGILGAILLSYGVLLEAERRQDAVFVISSAALFVYALWINSEIFMFATALMFLISGRELIQILRGKHVHTTELKQP